MNHLFIDTSTKNCSLYLSLESKLIFSKSWISDNNQSEELNKYFAEIKNSLAEINYLGILTGPGGFNSLRIGISFALALSLSKNINLISLPTHLVQAIDSVKAKKNTISIVQCGKNMTSWAEFKNGQHIPINSGITKDKIFEGEKYCGESNDQAGLNPRPYEKILEASKYMIEKVGYTEPENILPIYAKEPSISTPKEPYKKFENQGE
jgi:tRNA threonylcarbamoyl adenosine modification protein YeaZ